MHNGQLSRKLCVREVNKIGLNFREPENELAKLIEQLGQLSHFQSTESIVNRTEPNST